MADGTGPISYDFGTGSLDPNDVLGSGLVPPALQPNALTLSPDISDATAANRPWAPAPGGLQRSFQNPLALPTNAAAPAAEEPPSYPPWGGPPPYIQDPSGKAIANPEYKGQGSGRVGNWTWDDQQEKWLPVAQAPNALQPNTVPQAALPPDVPPAAAGQDPRAPGARGSTVQIPGGETYQLTQDEIAKYYSLLNPADQNAKAYAYLRGLPKEAQVSATPPGTPQTSLQPGGGATGAPPNALSPPVPGQPMGAPQPTAPPYNQHDLLKHFEAPGNTGLVQSNDEGSRSIGYGHTITQQEINQGYIAGPAGEHIPLDRITPDQKELIFQADMPRYMAGVRDKVPGFDKLSSNQQEALFSYYYNTGYIPQAAIDGIKAGNFKAASEAIRAGPYTGVQSGYLPGLERRRNAEADLFMMPDGTHPNVAAISSAAHGYTSGQVVPGTGYRVGGAAAGVAQPAPETGLTTPFMSDNPFAPKPPGVPGTPAQNLAELNERDRRFRTLQLFAMLGGMNKGVKFTPIGYDPFKVKEAGMPERVQSPPVVQPPGPIQSAVSMQQIPRTRVTGISSKIEGI